MTVYFVELGFCFQPRPTAFTLEDNACLSLDQANEDAAGGGGGQQAMAPWTDGTFWLDFNGCQVGWIELDTITFFPPLSAYPPCTPIPPPVEPPTMAVSIPTGSITMTLTAALPPTMAVSIPTGDLTMTLTAAPPPLNIDTGGITMTLTAFDPVAVTFGGEVVTFNGEVVTFNG